MAARSTIRLVDEVDPVIVDQIKELEYRMFGRGGLNEWHIPFVIRNGKVYVVELGSRIIGAAELIRKWDRPFEVYMIGLSIDKKYQGRKIGKKLLEAIVDDMKKEMVKEIFLTVDENNKSALSLYLGMDFEKIDSLKGEYGVGADRILMRKRLDG